MEENNRTNELDFNDYLMNELISKESNMDAYDMIIKEWIKDKQVLFSEQMFNIDVTKTIIDKTEDLILTINIKIHKEDGELTSDSLALGIEVRKEVIDAADNIKDLINDELDYSLLLIIYDVFNFRFNHKNDN